MENKDGVWRTIRGRRIFIGKGEDLSTAMKNSGKFKKITRQDMFKGKRENKEQELFDKNVNRQKTIDHGRTKQERKEKEYNEMSKDFDKQLELERERHYYDNPKISNEIENGKHVNKKQKEIVERYKAKKQSNNHNETYDEAINRIDKIENFDERKQAITDYVNKTGTSRDIINDALAEKEYDRHLGEEYEKRFGKQSNNKVDNQDMPYERDLNDVIKSLNDEGSDFSWSINEYKDGKASLNVGVFMPDERGYVDRDVEFDLKGIKGNTAEGYSQIEDKIREWQDKHSSPDTFYDDDNKQEKIKTSKAKDEKDWLPKATEIKEQGTSNRKQVSDNIQAHILEYYGPDYTGEDISAEDAFVRQMDAMKEPTMWKSGQRIAEGGSYLIYNGDMADFLDSLKINPKGKKFSDDKAFQTYTSLIGRESAKLYDKIKKHQAETINNYKKRKGK